MHAQILIDLKTVLFEYFFERMHYGHYETRKYQ